MRDAGPCCGRAPARGVRVHQYAYTQYLNLYIPYVAHGGRHSGFSFPTFSFCISLVCLAAFISFKEKGDQIAKRESYARPIKHRLVAYSLSLLHNCYFHFVPRRRRSSSQYIGAAESAGFAQPTYRFLFDGCFYIFIECSLQQQREQQGANMTTVLQQQQQQQTVTSGTNWATSNERQQIERRLALIHRDIELKRSVIKNLRLSLQQTNVSE